MAKVNNSGSDFIYWLGNDMSTKILSYLDDPTDLVRVASVSKLWHQFVVENGFCKELCLKKFPELVGASCGIESKNMIEPSSLEAAGNSSWGHLKRSSKIYSFLAKGLSETIRSDCIAAAISASSTDNDPIESIQNTLEARDRFENGHSSYWSSGGEIDPNVPETLLYRLSAKLCLVTEIHLQPFQAYFQYGFPIYSCKGVRFRMGHVKDQKALESAFAEGEYVSHDDRFVWTYVSPTFPVAKENALQKFELPEPALCIGGFLLVELLGRDQRQYIDGLYYICIAHVQVVGRPLSPNFDVEMVGPTGICRLKYHPRSLPWEKYPIREVGESSRLRAMLSRFVTSRLRTIISTHQTMSDHQDEFEEMVLTSNVAHWRYWIGSYGTMCLSRISELISNGSFSPGY